MRLWFFLIIGLCGTAVLVSLGVWQLQRLHWKEAILAEIDSRMTRAAVALPAAPSPEADRYLQVRVAGDLSGSRLFVLSSLKGVGPIYRIIERLDMAERSILVDRGGIPVAQRDGALSTGAVDITGTLHWPDEQDSFTPEPDGDLWFARHVPAMAEALETEPVLVIATTLSPPDPNVTPLPLDSAGISNNHFGYAVQWFGLALVWAGMTLWAAMKARRKGA